MMLIRCALLAAILAAGAMPAAAQSPFSGARGITVTMTRDPPAEVCIASRYGLGDGYHGKRTASGERFDTYKLTAAHRSRPFGTRVLVTNAANGRAVTVRINDRGPFVKGRCIDLSWAAARAIGMGGLARVSVQ